MQWHYIYSTNYTASAIKFALLDFEQKIDGCERYPKKKEKLNIDWCG